MKWIKFLNYEMCYESVVRETLSMGNKWVISQSYYRKLFLVDFYWYVYMYYVYGIFMEDVKTEFFPRCHESKFMQYCLCDGEYIMSAMMEGTELSLFI